MLEEEFASNYTVHWSLAKSWFSETNEYFGWLDTDEIHRQKHK